MLGNSSKAIYLAEKTINLNIKKSQEIPNYITNLSILCYSYNKIGDQNKILFAF